MLNPRPVFGPAMLGRVRIYHATPFLVTRLRLDVEAVSFYNWILQVVRLIRQKVNFDKISSDTLKKLWAPGLERTKDPTT